MIYIETEKGSHHEPHGGSLAIHTLIRKEEHTIPSRKPNGPRAKDETRYAGQEKTGASTKTSSSQAPPSRRPLS